MTSAMHFKSSLEEERTTLQTANAGVILRLEMQDKYESGEIVPTLSIIRRDLEGETENQASGEK